MADANDPPVHADFERIQPLWRELDRLMNIAGPGESVFDRRERPWETRFPDIRAAWTALTASANLAALEAWARRDGVDVIERESAARAVADCSARLAGSVQAASPRGGLFARVRGPLRLRERLSDWEEDRARVAAAEAMLSWLKDSTISSAFVAAIVAAVLLIAGLVTLSDPARPGLWGASRAACLLAGGAASGGLAAGLVIATAAVVRGSAGGGRLVRTLRALVGATLPTTLIVIAFMAWLVREAIAGREPWYAPVGGSFVVAGMATAPLAAVWALTRYRDVYADADARPPLSS